MQSGSTSVPVPSSSPPSGLAGGDQLTTSVLHFLHAHDAVCNVQITERAGVSSRDLSQWERVNGVPLPIDLRSFYSITDGWQLRWSVRRGDAVLPIGNLHINSLAQLKRVHMSRFRIRGSRPPSSDDFSSDEEEVPAARRGSSRIPAAAASSFPQAFDLDSSCSSGLVVLLYASAAAAPVVHWIDRAGTLHPIGRCFADYFRAALMHVGVPHWHCAYGDAGGMPDDAAQWLRFLSPQRLAIDQAHAHTRAHAAARPAASAPNQRTATTAATAAAIDLSKIEELAQSLTAKAS